MSPKLQIKLFYEGNAVEVWTYIPELKIWRDELSACDLSIIGMIKDIMGAAKHTISIIDGTHP